VAADGVIAPGVLLTAEGIRIEQDTATSVVVPAGDATHTRFDLIVCNHEYEKTVPAPAATFEVIEGTPAASPAMPEIPEHCTLLAVGVMLATETEWDTVIPAPKVISAVNCYVDADQAWHVRHGDEGAMLMAYEGFNDHGGEFKLFVLEAGTLADDAVITWGDAQLTISAEGIQACVELQTSKMDKAGGTFDGPVEFDDTATFNDAAIFNHEDPTAVAFDDWITFTRHAVPAQANSHKWLNKTYYWESVTDPTGTTLIVPIPAMVGAELVSVDIGLKGHVSIDYECEVGLSKVPFGNMLGTVDFSEETWDLTHNVEVFTNLVVKDPVTPFGALPYAFVDSETLYLRVRTGAAGILFTGARFNYRRKRIAV